MLDAVGIELGIGDLEVDDGVDLHGDVILGNNRLGRIVKNLLLEADLLCHALNERDLEVNADGPDIAERAEPLDDIRPRLLDDIDVADDDDQRQHRDDKYGNPFHKYILLMVFLFFVSDEKMTYGSTAQFGKLIRREIFHQVKVRKVKEYSMYFELFKPQNWWKGSVEARRRNCAVLPYASAGTPAGLT